jgi:outer membrane biosynthesis protein TonB
MKKIKSNVRFVMGEKEAEQVYPHAFAKGLGVDFDMVKKESLKESLIVGERLVKPVEKLPPVREPVKVMPQPQPVQQPEPKPKPKPRRLFDDFDFMVED